MPKEIEAQSKDNQIEEQSVIVTELFSGPIPHPTVLDRAIILGKIAKF